jgi:hypothetical protein
VKPLQSTNGVSTTIFENTAPSIAPSQEQLSKCFFLAGNTADFLCGTRFEVFSAVTIQVVVFWVVTLSSNMVGYQYFRQ